MNVSRSDAIISLTKAEGEAPSPAAPAGTPLTLEEIERRFRGALHARSWTTQQFTGKTFGGPHDEEALEYARFIQTFLEDLGAGEWEVHTVGDANSFDGVCAQRSYRPEPDAPHAFRLAESLMFTLPLDGATSDDADRFIETFASEVHHLLTRPDPETTDRREAARYLLQLDAAMARVRAEFDFSPPGQVLLDEEIFAGDSDKLLLTADGRGGALLEVYVEDETQAEGDPRWTRTAKATFADERHAKGVCARMLGGEISIRDDEDYDLTVLGVETLVVLDSPPADG